MQSTPQPSSPSLRSAFQLIGQVGLTMVIAILAGIGAGIKLDAWLGGRGTFIVLGIVAGILVGAGATGLLLYRSGPWKP